tara:strand:- start:283 stop:384 length:102 start_codon:yes stop_codon:yes gene_type:complete
MWAKVGPIPKESVASNDGSISELGVEKLTVGGE